MARKRKEITDILLEVGAMKPPDAQRALDEAGRTRRPLHEVILDLKLASEEEVTKALAYQYDMEYIDLDKSMMAASNFNLIPRRPYQKAPGAAAGKEGWRSAHRHRRPDGHRHHRRPQVPPQHEAGNLPGREIEDQISTSTACLPTKTPPSTRRCAMPPPSTAAAR